MQRFKNILVVVDERTDNRTVVERAVELARRNQASLTLISTVRELPAREPVPEASPPVEGIDIIEEWPSSADGPAAPESPVEAGLWPARAPRTVTEPAMEFKEYIVEEKSQRLERWVESIRRSGVPVRSKILLGTPFLEIIREVLRNGHDLVITATGGSSALRERLFGSTTMHLLRKCPCPVWVVKPGQPEWHTRILAAVDPTSPDEEQNTVNIKIMDLATSMARLQQCELIIVHAWTFPAEHSLRSGHIGPSTAVDKWVAEAREVHKRRLNDLLRPYALQEIQFRVYLLKGGPGHLIPEVAAKLEVGLIVMGTVSRSGVAGLLIGNTAERILRQVDCSVLAVKPDGFISPVRVDG